MCPTLEVGLTLNTACNMCVCVLFCPTLEGGLTLTQLVICVCVLFCPTLEGGLTLSCLGAGWIQVELIG